MDLCRICLTKRPEKDILRSQIGKKDNKYTCAESMMFCLTIQVEKDSKISTKLCLKCFKKLVAFHKFKTLALTNDEYLKSVDSNNEIFIAEDIEVKIKSEEECMDSKDSIDIERYDSEDIQERYVSKDIQEGYLSKDIQENYVSKDIQERYDSEDIQVKNEPNDIILKTENDDSDDHYESEDELLSVIKKIKYEYVVEHNKEKATAHFSTKKKKRSKVSKLEINKKHMCEECGKSVWDLKTHSYLHMPAAARRRIKCHVCDKTFSSHSSRYKHNKIKHLGLKKKCNICNKAVTSMKSHMLVMHNKEKLPFGCIECDRRFISKSILEQHMRSHTKDRPFACDLCDKKFSSNALLTMHKRCVHEKERLHMCQLCSKSFFKKYHLQKHLLSHAKEKTFECPDCGKFYKTDSTLRNHRQIHGDVRNYACELCSQTFMKKNYLAAHMISHTKVKRYPCQYCGVKFHRSDHRKRHEYTAHQKHLITSTNTELSVAQAR